jgi:Fe-S cluster assembly scaffold protein SufB
MLGKNKCRGHIQCDSIIMDQAVVRAVPEISAYHTDAQLIHEAAIGKIASEQILKLMSLGLTENEAEEKILEGFLK